MTKNCIDVDIITIYRYRSLWIEERAERWGGAEVCCRFHLKFKGEESQDF